MIGFGPFSGVFELKTMGILGSKPRTSFGDLIAVKDLWKENLTAQQVSFGLSITAHSA